MNCYAIEWTDDRRELTFESEIFAESVPAAVSDFYESQPMDRLVRVDGLSPYLAYCQELAWRARA